MPRRRWLLLPCVLIGIGAFSGGSHAQGPTAALHVVGDIPGGGATTRITDATRVGGVIYAVGGAVARVTCPTGGPCASTDAGILWRSDGSALQVLPDVVSTSFDPAVSASAITPDGAYIASTARDLNTSTTPASSILRAVRVETNSLTNLNLSAFSPPVTVSAGAVTISTDGTILYGRRSGRGIRFDTSNGTDVLIPLVCPVVNAGCPVTADNFNPVAERGSSANGSVAVGSSFNTTSLNPRRKAYRYVHGSGVTRIPFLPGGSVNNAVAVSPDGDLVLVTGNASGNPNEEVYLYRASTGEILQLGSPNTWWQPGGRLCTNNICGPLGVAGGMTFDGSVVAMSFAGQAFPGESSAYLHNAHGWFQFKSVLAANGIDFSAEGWGTGTGFQIHGISPDGTLVYGSGVHGSGVDEATVKGFVAEFGAGVLAAFNPQATAPADTSIVGVWTNDPSDPDGVDVFTADGVYYSINGDGFERGFYTFDGNRLMLTTLFDTNGAGGLSGGNGLSMPLTVIGDTLDSDGEFAGQRIVGSPGSIVGGWVGGNPLETQNSIVLAFAQSKYFAAYDFPDGHESEAGTYTWDPVSNELIGSVGGVVDPGNFLTLLPDALGIHVVNDGGDAFDVTRVVDPATIPVISNPQLSASGVGGQAFSYGVTATNAVTFSATGLPGGLSINSSTGEISGTPIVGGQFAVTISASNAIGVSDIETLTLTLANQLTVTGAPETAAYGSSFTVGTSGGGGGNVLVVSFEASDACSNTDGGALITMTAGWGACVIRATKAGDTNFEPTTSSPAFVVATRAQARVAAAAATKVYGSRDPALTGSVTGFLPADDITVGFVRAHGEAVVGSPYTIHAQISAPDGVGVSVFQNYDISSISAEFTITRFPLVIAANDITRQYGVPSPALTSYYGSVPEVGGIPFLAVPPTLSTLATLASDVGIYRINIDGAADPNYAISHVPGRLTITPAPTKVTLRSSSNPSKKGETVTLTATVVFYPPLFLNVYPEGSVTILGTGVVSPTARLDRGVATSSFKYRTLGSYPLTVQYEPSTTTFNFARSEDENEYGLTQEVGKAPTNDPTLTSSTNPAYYGQGLSLTARVTSPYVDLVDGYVTFQDGGKVIGREPLIGGYATLVIPPSATPLLAYLGIHVITAAYDGNKDFEKSFVPATLYQSIGPIFTTTTFTVNPIDIIYSHAVTVTARVSSVPLGAPTPRGTVSFVSGLGPVVDVPLDDTGTATRIVSTLPAGVNVIQAAYRGFFGGPQIGTIFAPSHGASKDVNVRKASINIKLDLRDPAIKIGQNAVLVATVYFPDSAVSSGDPLVSFYDGLLQLGSARLGNAQPRCSCAEARLVVHGNSGLLNRPGIHSMTAKVFAGNNYIKEDASKPENATSTPQSLTITVK